MLALKQTLPLITYFHAWAQRADVRNLHNAQAKSEANGACSCRPGAAVSVDLAQFGPPEAMMTGALQRTLARRRSRRSMQALPDLMMFASSMTMQAGLVREGCSIMSKECGQVHRPKCLPTWGTQLRKEGLARVS